jgi:exonuclease VII large subunit
VLGRGYGITRDAAGAWCEARTLKQGELLSTTFADGWAHSEVRAVHAGAPVAGPPSGEADA